jgi:hypothetical protein
MSTRIDSVEAAPAPRGDQDPARDRHRPHAAGDCLAVGLIVGGLLAGSDQQAASASETSAASPAKVPTLSWKDDYGTRHPEERP